MRRQRIKAGRFFDVTCSEGHSARLTGYELNKRLRKDWRWRDEIYCEDCSRWRKVKEIGDGPPMNEKERQKQEEEEQARQNREEIISGVEDTIDLHSPDW